MSPLMGGHRRDQSDSHVPLRNNDFHDPEHGDIQELGVVNGIQEFGVVYGDIQEFGVVRMSSVRAMDNGGIIFDPHIESMHPADPSIPIVTAKHWKREAIRTLVAFLCMLISAFLNFFLLTVIHDVVPRQPLPDLVFMVIPQQRWAWAVGDVFSTINAIVGFAVVLLHRERLVVLRRVLLLGAIMYGLRAICLGVTFLPPSFHNREEICQPQVNRTAMYAMEVATRFVTYVVTLGLTSGQEKILCGDLMFSGHTVVLTIMYFTVLQYTPRGLVALRYAATPITFLGIAALVVSGGHYTIDVLIAYWLTSHVFWAYHQMFELPRERRPHAPMSRLWWFWLCYWFEADVSEQPMVNEWDWPFPGPRFMHTFIGICNEKLRS